ncbi:MAG: reprolysin-like metallopeptidase [Pseudomonas capeferrum]|uniref:reprolysin-like metallopeptidase n=1 Tax=Pseudomonas capeferrum TaxID=1495066 RepID=UPI003D0DA628
MNTGFCAALLMVLSTSLLAGCVSSSAPMTTPETQSPLLFEVASDDLQTLQKAPGIYPSLAMLLNDPSTQQVQAIKVNASLISAHTRTLRVPVGNDKTIEFTLRRADPPAPGMSGWVGDVSTQHSQAATSSSGVDFDPFTWISLVREGDQLVGTLHVDGQLYRLESVGAGHHVLVKVDEAKLPPETDATANLDNRVLGESVGKPAQSAHSVIRVLFFTTNERRRVTPTYRAQLAQGMQNANQAMINSRVPITFELAGFIDPDYAEGNKTGGEQFADFRTAGRELNRQVVTARERLRADLVSLYTSYAGTGGEVAGGGYSIVGHPQVLAHEFGHHLGAGHGWGGNPGAGYNHGYAHDNPKFHTIMVTTWGAIPYFSNPMLYYDGVRMGTFEHHDVARVFNERREAVENTYPPMPVVDVQVTVFDNFNMQGDRCAFALPAGVRTTFIANVCGLAWNYKVRSVSVRNITPGKTLRVGNALAWHTYVSHYYIGDFDIRSLARDGQEVPEGMDIVPYPNDLQRKVTRIELLEGRASK